MSAIHMHTEPMVLRVARAIARYIGFGEEDITIGQRIEPVLQAPKAQTPRVTARESGAERGLRLVRTSETEEQQPSHKWRRHPQLRAYKAPLSEEVRMGRHEAVRGLYAASEGALEVATRHFAMAAECLEVDITATPGFWNLTRGQMQTAVDAYESVGRYRDAAALDAHIITMFRPSLVGTTPKPIVPMRAQQKTAST